VAEEIAPDTSPEAPSAPASASASEARRPSFWQRQVRGPITRGQWVFDALFGVAAPIGCLLLGGSQMPNGADHEVWTFTIPSVGWKSLGLPPPPD
jgi:hypothetical protein